MGLKVINSSNFISIKPLKISTVVRGLIVLCLFSTLLVTPLQSSAKTRHHHAASAQKSQIGIASFYGKKFHGRNTANGEVFNNNALTAAHLTLPFGSKVKVTCLRNGKSVIVRINDRGPHVRGRMIDLSYAAAKKIGLVKLGTAKVKLEVLN
jgi:rare lipoprotein A